MAPKVLKPKNMPTFEFEIEARKSGATLIGGIDEVGRGPLAGPVVAACVVLPEDFPQIGIDDSKRLLAPKREQLAVEIRKHAICWALGVIEPEEIDRVNIYQAARLAMKQAVDLMGQDPDFLLIDGNIKLDLKTPQRSIVKGDQLSLSIAAAAILAKVFRDALMNQWHERYPEYGFNNHKGYATQFHIQAVKKYGPCPIHRKTFKAVRDFMQLDIFVGA
jgi:ribonuclease HII